MSLRYQINIRILGVSLGILLFSGVVAIWQARNDVNKEVNSSTRLVLQLLDLSLSTVPNHINVNHWISALTTIEPTRHLNILLEKPSGQVMTLTHHQPINNREQSPPFWFIHLMTKRYPVTRYPITSRNHKPLTLIIHANPLDEITEVWQETTTFFATIFSLIFLTILAVNLVFNKSIKSINTIIDALKLIETGQYPSKIPNQSIREYNEIAHAINHMTNVLSKTHQQNRALTQHSLQIQEDERQRLAQELHDELGQSLTAIKVMAITAANQQSDTAKITAAIVDICDHLMRVVRSMMQHLHPLILSELGLKATLEDLVNQWKNRHPGLMIQLNCDDRADTLSNNVAIQIFRVIQECLTNIVRHAFASNVKIKVTSIEQPPQQLLLQIEDNGQGCDTACISSGFGLLGIQERIKSLEGDFSLTTSPGNGMKITITIPIV